ncbi:MAG: response regulator [Gemmatimonadota bacterium]
MKPLTILVVDDDPDMRLYMRGCLQAMGQDVGSVLGAADGYEALQVLSEASVDLIISDVVLPRMDGRTLLKAIRDDPVRQHLPVLLISGKAQVMPPLSPADAWLSKPFNARQLLAAVRRLMGQPPSP